jgi:ArsR family transcriptional regulator
MITKDIGIADILKVLADDTNLKVLSFLKLKRELCVCDLQNLLSTNQPNVSRHLKELMNVNLLSVRQDGKWHYYAIKEIPRFAEEILKVAIEEYDLYNVKFDPQKCD